MMYLVNYNDDGVPAFSPYDGPLPNADDECLGVDHTGERLYLRRIHDADYVGAASWPCWMRVVAHSRTHIEYFSGYRTDVYSLPPLDLHT